MSAAQLYTKVSGAGNGGGAGGAVVWPFVLLTFLGACFAGVEGTPNFPRGCLGAVGTPLAAHRFPRG